MIRAILRAQLSSMRLGRGGGRGAAFSALTAVIWYGFWCFLTFSVFGMTAQSDASSLEVPVRAGLFAVFIYWQLMPVLSSSLGAALDMRKLLLFPASHERLFLVELLLRALAGTEMMLIVAGGTAGILFNPAAGGWRETPGILAGALLFVGFNIFLASGLRSVLERLLSRSRVREFVILIGLTVLMLPRFLVVSGSRPEWLLQLTRVREDGMPWTAAANALAGRQTAVHLAVLCAWTALAWFFGRRQFERSLRYDAIAAQASASAAADSRWHIWAERFYRLPSVFWRDPLAALVEKELRTLSRSPRFRMVFAMGFSFGLLVWLPLVIGRAPSHSNAISRNFLVVVTVYAMTLMGQVSYWNSFGFDRSATQIYFAAPQTPAIVIAAKNLASMVFIYAEALILVGITLALRVPLSLGQVAETFVVLSVCSLYMLALGNISSVQFPRPLSPERVSQGGASSRFQALVFVFYPLALLPVFLAYVGRYLIGSDIIFWLLVAAAALIGAGLYWVATDSARIAFVRRREQIVQDLSRGEGPVADA